MNITNFLLGFGLKKPMPIRVGDTCREKETGVYSKCINQFQGLYYGRKLNGQLTVGKMEKYEKVV